MAAPQMLNMGMGALGVMPLQVSSLIQVIRH